MRSDEWQKVQELLNDVLEVEPGGRRKFLDEAAGVTPELRREVESLLACEPGTGGFLETPAIALLSDFFDGDVAADRAGQTVGHYRIIREIGRGGMGAVYLAERADGDDRQKVALKVIGRGLADADLRRRFRQERQILASLEHPNIARLLDGGVSKDGEPYLVMEYVEGARLDEYCDQKSLPTRARLRLFLEVCRGVSYAHQRLVVHRDIKPSNVLVTRDGVPKLLDFGIAKLLDPELTDGQQTRTELRAFTPDYASPEQVAGGQITTASDVYSLGVLLGDLLRGQDFAGSTPGAPGGWRSGTATVKTGATDPSTGRRGKPRTWSRRLAGAELDNIVAMARHDDPARRYVSAAELAEDVQRYLGGLPVRAQKDSVTYRVRKFARRNRVGVAAAAVVLLTLLAGVAATVWQSRRTAEQARIAAEQRDRARVEAAKAERVNAVMQNVLGFSETAWFSRRPQSNPNITVAEALAEAGRRAESELADQPEVQAAVRFVVGMTYLAQDRLDAAEPHLRAVLDIRRKVLGPAHHEVAQVLVALGELTGRRGDYAGAESLHGEAVSILRRAHDAGVGDVRWFFLALSDLGVMQHYRGDSAAAEKTIREALEVGSSFTGVDRSGLPGLYMALAGVRRAQGDLDGAIAHQEKSVEEFRRLPAGLNDGLGNALGNLAFYVMTKGDYRRAEALYLEGIEFYRGTLGETHPQVALLRINFAENYYAQGDYLRAREEIDRAIAIQRLHRPEGHVDYGLSFTVLGKVLTRTGDLKGGESYLRRALDTRTQALKQGHRWIAETQGALGENLTAQQRFAEAEPLLIDSHKALEAGLGQQDPRTREARRRLTALYHAWDKPDEATRFAQS